MKSSNLEVLDYLIFSVSVCVSMGIGIYVGCFRNTQNSITEYFYANKQLKAIPVGLSIFSSAISSIHIMGFPTEIYMFGTQFIASVFGTIFTILFAWTTLVPIFAGNLNLQTPYEYFERRFNKYVHLLMSLTYILQTVLQMLIVLFSSTLSLSQLTGISLPLCTTVVGGICTFYTTIGGFRSVVWADSLQATLILASCIMSAVIGIKMAGGFDEMWVKAVAGGRIQFFNMDPNPFQRMTFWSAAIGIVFHFIGSRGTSASTLQRLMALPNQKQSKISFVVSEIASRLSMFNSAFMGLAMYSLYYNCDPVKNNVISNRNQLVPHFISETLGKTPGLSGIFIAGLLSAGLSTLSTDLNTLGGIIYYDFLTKFRNYNIINTRPDMVIKIMTLFIGIIVICFTPLLHHSSYIFQLYFSISGIVASGIGGILILAMFFPMANSKGAICGSILSMSVITWIILSASSYKINSFYELPTSNEGCLVKFNVSKIINTTIQTPISLATKNTEPFFLYKLSFIYYPLFGALITIISGLIISYATGKQDVSKIDPLLIAPFLRPYFYGKQIKETSETELRTSSKIDGNPL